MTSALLPSGPLYSSASVIESWATDDVPKIFRQVFREQPRLSLSEWADEYGYLSDGQKWHTSVVPYLREPMDMVTDRRVREVVIMKSARIGYTEGVLGQWVGFSIHQSPERILVIQPTLEDAGDWSKKQLSPMIKAAPVLHEIIGDPRGRDAGNTILDKTYPGGSITIRGAHSPKGLRRHTARDVIFDEVDGFEISSRDEGDPIMLGTRANRTLPDRTTVLGSTPKHIHNSRILKALKTSDWREYHVPCPHCDHRQVLRWGGPDKDYGIKWPKDVFCKSCGNEADADAEKCSACDSPEFETVHDPDGAHYVCEHCGEAIEERHKRAMVAAGEWVPRYPGRSIRGYHISSLISPFDGAKWSAIAAAFLKAKDDPATLQVFVNQYLGEPWEERGQNAPPSLENMAEVYVGPDGEKVEVPPGVGILTAGVDVQGDRLELLVRGWGVGRESWDIFHERIYGDPRAQNTWGRLDFLLRRQFANAAGNTLPIMAAMIDSGYATDAVYSFVRPREHLNIWASKGDSGKPGAPPLKRPSRANADGVKLWTLGVYTLKDNLFSRLRYSAETEGFEGRSGPRVIHFRAADLDLCNGFDAEYFAQFGAEEKVARRVKGSRVMVHQFVQTRKRNEAIDLHVLADAAFRALGRSVSEDMEGWVEEANTPPPEPDDEPESARQEASDWGTGGGRWGSGW